MKWSTSLAIVVLGFVLSCQHPYTQGKQLYAVYCANCHMQDGSGLGAEIPPLKGSESLELRRQNVPCVIRYGSNGSTSVNGHVYLLPMPSHRNLNQFELSNVINYINTAWGNDFPETSPTEVLQYLEGCE